MRVDARTWGECWHAFANQGVECDLINIARGGHSSLHKHDSKGNWFVLVDGSLDILVYDDCAATDCVSTEAVPKDLVSEVRQLRHRGDSTFVAAKKWHQFVCLEDSLVVEVYTAAEPSPGDIVRVTKNGVLQEAALGEYASSQR